MHDIYIYMYCALRSNGAHQGRAYEWAEVAAMETAAVATGGP